MTAETITTSPLSASLPGRPGDHKKLDKQFHVDTVVTTSLTVGRRLASEPIEVFPTVQQPIKWDSLPTLILHFKSSQHCTAISCLRARLNIMIKIANHLHGLVLQNVDRDDDTNIRMASQHNH